MSVPVTGLFAGTLGVLCTAMASRVAFRRLFTTTPHGLGGATAEDKTSWERQVRAHSNAAEHVPIFLILLGCLEANKLLTTNQLVALGSVFTVARTAHSLQISEPKVVPLSVRVVGFLAQAGASITAGVVLIAKCSKKIKA